MQSCRNEWTDDGPDEPLWAIRGLRPSWLGFLERGPSRAPRLVDAEWKLKAPWSASTLMDHGALNTTPLAVEGGAVVVLGN